jgi:hypothetical protein
MPLNLKPATQSPENPGGTPAAKYSLPTRPSSMGMNTAPIAGVEPPAVTEQAADAEQQAEPGIEEQPSDIGWRLGKVARKEREARQLRQAAKAAEAQVRAREDAVAAREARLQAEEERRGVWRQNPAALLRDHGYVPEAALQFMLNGERMTPEQQLAATVDQRLAEQERATGEQLEALRKEQEQRDAEREADLARQQEQELTQQEQIAVQETQTEIADIVAGDPKAFPLVRRAGDRGVRAIYQRVNELWEEQTQRLGRPSPITTKMLERAAGEVEAAARKELQDGLADPEVAAALGMGARPIRQRTLTNNAPPAAVARGAAGGEETASEKYERVKREVAARLGVGRGQG